MRYYVLTIFAIFLLFPTVGSAQYARKDSDTLWVDSIVTHSGQKTIMEINFVNADTLKAIDLLLDYENPELLIDSVSFVGSRVPDIFVKLVIIDTAMAQIHIGALNFNDEFIPPGSGLLGSIFLSVPDEFPTQQILFDTTFIQTGALVFANTNHETYIPVFLPGYLDNNFAPSLTDSAWVDDITAFAGDDFEVPLYFHNELPLNTVQIPLKYPSNNIVIDSITTTGLRGESATIEDFQFDDANKKMLITLNFTEQEELPIGTGELVRLHFSAMPGGSTSTTVLDTTVYNAIDFYVRLGHVFNFIKAYPRFIPGEITIDISTDADDQQFGTLPREFALNQNYPNPFNPSTTITFALPKQSLVRLDVYNILGQKVKSLIDQILPAGEHQIDFDGRDEDHQWLASGIYFYRISADEFNQSRKMILLK